MLTNLIALVVGGHLGASMPPVPAGQGQSLAQRISSAPDGRIQFNFASREGACGDGRSFYRMQDEFNGSWGGGMNMPACVHGPVRVVLEQSGRSVVRVRTYVGPLVGPD